MKRLLIGLLLVTLLVSGCRQAVVTIPPLSAPTPTTTALTWDSVASLPVGTVVELTGYCTYLITQDNKDVGYQISQVAHPDNYMGQPILFVAYNISTANPPIEGTYLKVKIRIEKPNFQEISRTIIN